MHPRIAIIDDNTLQAIGLKSVFNDLVPMAEVCVYNDYEEFRTDGPEFFVHYFVSANLLIEDAPFFLQNIHKTMVLTNNPGSTTKINHFNTLNICQDEHQLIKSILQLFKKGHHDDKNRGHGAGHLHSSMPPHAGHPHAPHPGMPPTSSEEDTLSPREQEVLKLVAKGLLNKEIADQLCISMTTVISHRKNITEKLGIKSVSALTIYAVMHGIVRLEEI